MMRVRILEAEIKDEGLNLFGGDMITLEERLGTKWCDLGWAEDVTGLYPTGQRAAGVTTDLEIQSAILGHRADNMG